MATSLLQSILVVMCGLSVNGERGLIVEAQVLLVIGVGLLIAGLIKHPRKLKIRSLQNAKQHAVMGLNGLSILTLLLRSPKEPFIVFLKKMDFFESIEKSINVSKTFAR
jgi:hypothetical protein